MEKSILEMTDAEVLEHVRTIIKKREEQTVEKAVKKVREATEKTVKQKLKNVLADPSLSLLSDFFAEKKK